MVEYTRDKQYRVDAITEKGYAPWVALPGEPDFLSRQQEPSRYVSIERTIRFEYSDDGHLVAIDGPRDDVNDKTLLEWDQFSRLIKITSPALPGVSYSGFDGIGRPTVVQVGTSAPAQVVYDLAGNISSITQRGWTVTFERDAEGRVVTYTDARGNVMRREFDAAGRTVSIGDSFGRQANSTYDSEGRTTNKQIFGIDGNLLNSLDQFFDERGRLIEYSQQSSNTDSSHAVSDARHILWDESGEIASITDQHTGARLDVQRDVLNRVTTLSQSGSAITEFHFDVLGQASGVVDSEDNGVFHTRDDFGAVVGIYNPDTGVERLIRNVAGDVVERVREDSGMTRYIRDAAGRALERIDRDGLIVRWSYDPSTGRLHEMSNQGSTERFEYNANWDLVFHQREIDGSRYETRYEYNDRGLLVEKTLTDGQVLRYSYHDSGAINGMLESIDRTEAFGLLVEPIISEIDVEWRDGAGGWLSHNGLKTDIVYSARGDMVSIDVGGLSQFAYRYDHRDRLTQIEHDGQISTLGYGANRLTMVDSSAGTFSYQYDAAGNRLSETRQSGSDEQSQTFYTYATNENKGTGNRLIAITDGKTGQIQRREYSTGGATLDDGVRRYVYDNERRPIQVFVGETLLAEYRYNASGERIKKVVYDNAAAQTTTYFLYEDAQLAAEVDAETDTIRQYLYVQGHRPVALLAGDDVYAIHGDHLGAPHYVTDKAGRTVWEAAYEPFGQAIVSQHAIELSIRLPGQYLDSETGTHYNYFRDYDARTGRYLTADPIGLNGGLHHYAYANALPHTDIDPLGLRVRRPRNYMEPSVTQVIARLNYSQLIESIRQYEPTFVYSSVRPIRAPINEVDIVSLSMYLQSYKLRNAIRQFDSAFDFTPVGMPQQVNELARRLDAMVYIEQIRQTQDPNYSYPSDDYTEADLVMLGDLAEAGAAQCTAVYDADFSEYFDAQLLDAFIGDGVADELIALDENGEWYVPLSDIDELAYNDYTASGGALSRADWEREGKPANLLVEQFDSFSSNKHRQLLRDRLGGVPYDGWFAHHVIPLQILTEYPELMRKGAEGGFDINGILNGIMLRGEDHVGGHPGYNDDMVDAIGEININGSPEQIAQDLHDIAELYLNAIRNNTYGP